MAKVTCPRKPSDQPFRQIPFQWVANFLSLPFNPRNATEMLKNSFEWRVAYNLWEDVKIQFREMMINDFPWASLEWKKVQLWTVYDYFQQKLQGLQLWWLQWQNDKQLVAIDTAFKNMLALAINGELDYNKAWERKFFGPNAAKSIMEDLTTGSPVKFVWTFNKPALDFVFDKSIPDNQWLAMFDEYFGRPIKSDSLFLDRSRRKVLVQWLTGKSFSRAYKYLESMAKIAGISAILSYSVWAAAFGWLMSALWILSIGMVSAWMQIMYLRKDMLSNWLFSKSNRKKLYTQLWFKDDYFWYDSNPFFEWYLNNRYVKKTAEALENLMFRWFQWAAIPDLLGASTFRDRAMQTAIDKYFDPTLSEEENMQNLSMLIETDPNLKSKIIGDIVDLAHAEAWRNEYRRWSITELWPLWTVYNILGWRWLLKWKAYMRHLFGNLWQQLYKQEIDKGNPDAEQFYDNYAKNNAETGYAIAFTIHAFLWAWRIQKLVEGMDDPDEDDENIFKEMLTDGKARELFVERGSTVNNYLAAAFSNQYSRWMFELMELAFDNMWRWWEKESFYDALQDPDVDTDPSKVRTALFIKRKIDWMLRFIVPLYLWMQSLSDWYENGWDGFSSVLSDFNNRYSNYINSDMYPFEETGQKNFRSLVGEMNIFLWSQNNNFKNMGMDITQAGKFYNDIDGSTNPILWGIQNSKLMWFIRSMSNDFETIPLPDVIQAIESNPGVHAIVAKNDISKMSKDEMVYAFNQYTKDFGNYDINALQDWVSKNDYNEEYVNIMEAQLKKMLWDATYTQYKWSIANLLAQGWWAATAEQARILDLLAWKQAAEKTWGESELAWAPFFAYTLKLLWDEYANKTAWVKYISQLNPEDQLAAKARAFEQVWAAAIAISAPAWKNTVNYVLNSRIPEMNQYFTSIDMTKQWNTPKDLDLNSYSASELLYNAHLLWLRNLALWKPAWEFYTDMVVPFAQIMRNYDIIWNESDEVKARKTESKTKIDNIFVVAIAQLYENQKSMWFTDEEVAQSFTPIFLQNADKLQTFINDDRIPEDIKESVKKNLYGNFLNLVEMEALVKHWLDWWEIKKNFFWSEEFFYSPGSDVNKSWYRKLDFSGTWYYNTYSSWVKQNYDRFKSYYTDYKTWYLTNLNNTFKDYERTIFKDTWFEYNPQERAFLKARARYSKVISDYPVFDFQSVWDRSFWTTIRGFSKSRGRGWISEWWIGTQPGGKQRPSWNSKRATTNIRPSQVVTREAGPKR